MTGDAPTAIGQVFFEFRQIGPQMRVAAIDAASGIEVIIITPITATKQHMQNQALAKLKRRLQRQG